MSQPLSDKACRRAAAAWWSAQAKDETWAAKNIFPRPCKSEDGLRIVDLGYTSQRSGAFYAVVRLLFSGGPELVNIIDRREKRDRWP